MSEVRTLPDAAYYHRLSEILGGSYRDLQEKLASSRSWPAAWRAQREDSLQKVEAGWETLASLNIALSLERESAYPKLLREIPFPPHALYTRGEASALQDFPRVAIVGTRRASTEGKELARSFSRALASSGVAVVSGLALGIDAAAHEGALEARGVTIGVLGNGLEKPHPRTNQALAARIIENHGALVSEYSPHTPPLPFRFLERNRIVSGLSQGTLVIEAPEHSGALVTARFALEQNRSVFVVPGAARNPQFKGSHALIREGAELVTEPQQILEALQLAPKTGYGLDGKSVFSEEERRVVAMLAREGRALSVDKIIELTHLKAHSANRLLTFLVLKGAVQEDSSGSYSVRQGNMI